MKLLDRIFKRRMTDEQRALVQLANSLKVLQNHIIALARLQFIKPESLVRESDNVEENLSYLNKLIEIRENNETK